MRRIGQALRAQHGQSTVEYIILATAVMAVILIFFNGEGSVFQKRLNSTLDQTTNDITDRGEKLFDGHGSDEKTYAGPTDAYKLNSMTNII